MDNFGTDSTTTAHDGRRSINLTMINGGLFGASAGNLDSVSIFGDEDGGGFNNYRLAVYQGGTSDTDPAGATQIWDSGEQTCPAGAAAWRTVTAGGQALAANTRTWVALRTGDEFHPHYAIITDEDDATYNVYTWSQNNSATAYEATVPAVSLDGTAAFKWYLTFTVGGGTTTTTTLTSNTTVTDQSVAGAIRNMLLQSLLTVAEGSTIVSTIYGMLLSDEILISDQSSQFLMRHRLAESNIVITDEALATVIGSAILTRVLTSNIDVADDAVYSILRNRLLQDTLIISEGQTEAYTTTNFLADDELTVTDSIVTRLLLTRLLGDSIDLSDAAIAAIIGENVISAILSSAIATSDDAILWMNRVRFGDSFVLPADEVIKVLRFTRQLTDTIDAADESLSALQRFILLTDALSVDDSIVSLVNTPTTSDPVILIGFDQPRIDIGGYAI